MIFGAFENTYHRYLSESAVEDLLDQAKDDAVARDVLVRHLKTGLFTYLIDTYRNNKYLGLVQFRHFAILERLFQHQYSLDALTSIVKSNMASLSNTVRHKPYEEFAGLLTHQDHPMSVLQLRRHTEHLADWIAHVREAYLNQPFHARARKTTISIALDLMRLIQANQENESLKENVDPFARAGVTDRKALVEALHHALLTLSQDNVIDYARPENVNLEWLLDRPDLAAACSPKGRIIPIPSISVFEDIALQTGQSVPRSLIVSPDTDEILNALTENPDGINWGLHESGTGEIQAFVIRSPMKDMRYSVYVVRIDIDMVSYVGDLVSEDREEWGERLTTMIDCGASLITREVKQLSSIA